MPNSPSESPQESIERAEFNTLFTQAVETYLQSMQQRGEVPVSGLPADVSALAAGEKIYLPKTFGTGVNPEAQAVLDLVGQKNWQATMKGDLYAGFWVTIPE